jgi:hypothetical protein
MVDDFGIMTMATTAVVFGIQLSFEKMFTLENVTLELHAYRSFG